MVQYADSEAALLDEYNRHGNWHEIRDGQNGRELWHKGHRRLVGVIQPAEDRE